MFGAKMPRTAGRKFAIFAVISECLIYVSYTQIFLLRLIALCLENILVTQEGKYCAFEIHGEPKYYVCPRTEYCCNIGCCGSPGFQIYHLWYYWLLVIIMFLVCSGGGWWYRYWLQGRYRAAASALPPRQSGSRTQNATRGSSCQAQQARVTFNPARNTVLLHRAWKGPQRSATPPAYYGAAAASSTHFQNTNVVLTDNNCPYYKLYGPPPSYETVIAQTRGKILSPTSPQHPRTITQPPAAPIESPVYCFVHPNSPSARLTTGSLKTTRLQSGCTSMRQSGSYAGLGFAHFSPSYSSERVLRSETDFPPAYRPQECSTGNGSNSSFSLEASTIQGGNETGAPGEREPSESSLDGGLIPEEQLGRNAPGYEVVECQDGERLNCSPESHPRAADCGVDGHCMIGAIVSRSPRMFGRLQNPDSADQSCGQASQYGSLQGRGSNGRAFDLNKQEQSSMWEERIRELCSVNGSSAGARRREFDSVPAASPTSTNCTPERNAQNGTSSSQRNPSNNVILPSSSSTAPNDSSPRINITENYQYYPPTSATQRLADSNSESERKLDRSRSLD